MNAQKALWVGLVGSVVAAICCFTPVLVIVFGALGLTALLAWTDLVLLLLLGVFLVLTVVAALKMRRAA